MDWPWYRINGSCCPIGIEITLNGTVIAAAADLKMYSKDTWCAVVHAWQRSLAPSAAASGQLEPQVLPLTGRSIDGHAAGLPPGARSPCLVPTATQSETSTSCLTAPHLSSANRTPSGALGLSHAPAAPLAPPLP